jgi:uncharacterized membrane protein YfcA
MALILGVIVGAVLGLTGAGGSILAVPLLMFGLGWTLPQAAPVALFAVCASATFGTVVAWDVTHVRYRAAALMGIAALLGAPLGLATASLLPLPVLTGVFALVLAFVGARLLRQAITAPAEAAIVRATVSGDGSQAGGRWIKVSEKGRILWNEVTFTAVSAIGVVTGFVAGMLGVGGGFVIVPALRYASGLSMHSAVATSLLAVALISAVAAATASVKVSIDWSVAGLFVLGALAGMFAGRKLAPRIAGPRLQQGFAVVMLTVAVGLLAKAIRM